MQFDSQLSLYHVLGFVFFSLKLDKNEGANIEDLCFRENYFVCLMVSENHFAFLKLKSLSS